MLEIFLSIGAAISGVIFLLWMKVKSQKKAIVKAENKVEDLKEVVLQKEHTVEKLEEVDEIHDKLNTDPTYAQRVRDRFTRD